MNNLPTQYWFLAHHYDDLVSYLDEIKAEIAEIQSQVAFATSQSSETWHDNIMHEELMRKFAMEEARFDHYRAIQRQALVVEPNPNLSRVGIGNLVGIERDSEEFEFRIGSYMIIRTRHHEIAYSSPLGAILFGANLGATLTGDIAGRPVQISILAIKD